MQVQKLILKPIINSTATLVCTADGTVVGRYTFLNSFEPQFPFRYMTEFLPTDEIFFSPNIEEVFYCLENTWMLFSANTLI